MRSNSFLFSFIAYHVLCFPFLASEKEVIDAFTSIGREGNGNERAADAIRLAGKLNVSSIQPLLESMNEANPVGDNWIRAAIGKILEGIQGKDFPSDMISGFLREKQNSGSSRKTAFELLMDHRPKKAKLFIEGFIDDPEPSLRRIAVDQILEKAYDAKEKEVAFSLFERVLEKGRDASQIKEAQQALQKAGRRVDLIKIMGFLVDWNMIGPFDNTGRQGFYKMYPPETKDNLTAWQTGKMGKVSWNQYSTSDPFGLFDINEHYGEIKEVLAYLKTDFYSAFDRKAHFRIGSKNAWKIWVNGDLLFARDEYHRGKTRIDQFIVEGELQGGKNEILLKVCQNEQTQSWTRPWEFCLRVTDPTGAPIHSFAQ